MVGLLILIAAIYFIGFWPVFVLGCLFTAFLLIGVWE